MAECLINPGLILYILLAAVAGMIYGLRKIFKLEQRIIAIDEKIEKKLLGSTRANKRTSKKPGKKR